MPRFSILIPARNEEKYLPGCLESLTRAAEPFRNQVEVIVAVNRSTDRTEEIALAHGAVVVRSDARNLAKIRNTAAKAASGDIIVTVDADSRMSPRMLLDIDRLLRTGRYIGGGVMIWPERWSLGIMATGIMLLPLVLRHRVSGGLFWCLREDFEAIGGFDETWVSVEDLDFAKRLKAYGKSKGKRFGTIMRSHIVTSCRKFDRLGDWFLIRDPGFVRRIFTGKSQRDADRLYYDFDR
ncbi:MAG TPA: glycosyltransferase [Planctomycetaceae bacterium]|jgi:glycosyltransferase involved in cell wall biosynthesis|nr:glycosyltransferase [Planctomycetaceae bacterium]